MLPNIFLLVSITLSVMAEQKDDPPQTDTLQSLESAFLISPWKVQTKFLLYTRQNSIIPQEMSIASPETIQSSNLDPSRNTIMMMPNFREDTIASTCRGILSVSNLNCFGVVGRNLSEFASFLNASNIRVIEAEIKFFGGLLQNFGFQPPDLQLVGFGMGAQLAGMVGNGEGQIGRITALNPPPLDSQSTPLRDRLDKSDAKLVDVIYTAGSGSGTNVDIGHLEFIVNGGEHMPGCEATSDNPGQGDQSTCDDMRSIMYYRESIPNPDGFRGYSASSYEAFQQGDGFPCPGIGCPTMGYNAASYPGITSDTQRFYLNTGAEKPFSCERYKITFEYFDAFPVSGSLSWSLTGSNGESENHALSRGEIKPGATLINYSYIASLIADPIQPALYWIGDTSAQLGPTMLTLQSGKDASILSFCFDDPILPAGGQVPIPCA